MATDRPDEPWNGGRFELRQSQRQLLVDGKVAELGARAFDVLLTLVAHQGHVVTKAELLSVAWPGVLVEENNLHVQVSALRKILGAGAIATVPGRGYQLTIPLSGAGTGPSSGFQLWVDETPQAAPKRGAPETRLTNLPRHSTSIIGRETELQKVKELIGAHRMVTLTGPGGVGKTRLAIEAGLELIPEFADGIWLVELAPLSDPALVVSTVGTTLRLTLRGSLSQRDILINHLENLDLLIILDNCEHLIDAVGQLADGILTGTSRVRILATSQELIGISGERALRMASLGVPAEDEPGVTQALEASAVRMFIDRLKSIDAGFEFDDKAAPIAANVCKRLDGLPLALEMAAARVSVLGLHAVAQGLDDRFSLLTAGKRTALARQRTLHAALDWSHALLSENSRKVFRRIGSFSGGFTLEAVRAVVADESLRDFEVIDGLSDLVAKSLVVPDAIHGATRYRLLETTRAYAIERLKEAGEPERVSRRHALYFQHVMEHCIDGAVSIDSALWEEKYAPELENVRAATAWAFGARGDDEIGTALVVNSRVLFEHLGLYDECGTLLEHAQKTMRPTTTLSLQLLFWAAMGSFHLNGGFRPSDDAVDAFGRAFALSTDVDDAVRWHAVNGLCFVHAIRGELEPAERVFALLTPIVQRLGGSGRIAFHRLLAGVIAELRGDAEAARHELQQAAQAARSSGSSMADSAEILLAHNLSRAGQHAAAIAGMSSLRDRIRTSRFPDLRRLQAADAALAPALLQAGRHREAVEAMRETLEIGRKIGTMMHGADVCVFVLATAGQLQAAARFAGWIDAWATREPGVVRMGVRMRPLSEAILKKSLSASEIKLLMKEGAALDARAACALIEV